MSGGLFALLDDVAVLARSAAASVDDISAAAGRASGKAIGVVVDDTAVTPQFLEGARPARELPMIWRIARGSLVNKLVIILPIALVLSQFLPWALTPILMLGGSYLCFEGMEKVWEKISGSRHSVESSEQAPGEEHQPRDEDGLVKAAIFTDLILSAEIMVISLNEVADESFWRRAIILVVVGILITILVYGVVATLVKMDDVGMRLAEGSQAWLATFGRGLVRAMPVVLNAIGVVGTLAMVWVGGHIMVVGLNELGLSWPFHVVHYVETLVPVGIVAWLVNTAGSLIAGSLWGGLLVLVWSVLPWHQKENRRAQLGATTPGAVAASPSNRKLK